MTDIGKPEREYEIQPLEDPLPLEFPIEQPERETPSIPTTPQPVPVER